MKYVALIAIIGTTLSAGPLSAGSLQVSPVSVKVVSPATSATVTLRNQGTAPIHTQVRVFRWSESEGAEQLTPTTDVVASPPIVSLEKSVDYVVRIVRTARTPMTGSENYRIIVDELPSPKSGSDNGVTLLMRYSIPIFFEQPSASDGVLTWEATARDGKLVLSAKNSGDRHVRVSALKVDLRGGKSISFGDGLAGYVLGHATRTWTAPAVVSDTALLAGLVISGETNSGSFRASPSAPKDR